MTPGELGRLVAIADGSRDLIWDDVSRSFVSATPVRGGVWLIATDWRSDGTGSLLRSYTGEAVLVDLTGEPEVLHDPIRISTHPGQRRTSATHTPDVDGDGQRDVAWALPRVRYEYKGRRSRSGRFDPSSRYQPVRRDVAGRGRVDGLTAAIHPATAIQYHAGSSSGPISIGCFTSPPVDYDDVASVIERVVGVDGRWSLVFDWA